MNINKIIIFGNSSGGYAALLFGYLLLKDGFPVKEVHSFVPMMAHETSRFKEYAFWEPEYCHLKDFFKDKVLPSGIFNIYCAKDYPEDVSYAYNLNSPWISIYLYNHGSHGLAKVLRNQGILQEIIKKSINFSE